MELVVAMGAGAYPEFAQSLTLEQAAKMVQAVETATQEPTTASSTSPCASVIEGETDKKQQTERLPRERS